MLKKAGRPRLPKSKKRSEIVRIRLTDSEARQVRRIARDSDLTAAQVARQAVLYHISKEMKRNSMRKLSP